LILRATLKNNFSVAIDIMLLVKIIAIFLLIVIIITSLDFIKINLAWFILYTFYISLFILAFHEHIMKILFKIRDFLTTIIFFFYKPKKVKRNFIELGGITGFEPIKDRHIAIIFLDITDKVYPVINQDKKLLIDYYKNNGYSYRLYFCYLADDFVNIIKSQSVEGIHIFGHGSIDHLIFKDGVVYYREFTGINLKDFVGQWHCNIGKFKDKHLGNIAKKYFIPKGYTNFIRNKKNIKKLIEGKLEWTINKKIQ